MKPLLVGDYFKNISCSMENVISHQERSSFIVQKHSQLSGHFKQEEPNYLTRIEIFKMSNIACLFQPKLLLINNKFY